MRGFIKHQHFRKNKEKPLKPDIQYTYLVKFNYFCKMKLILKCYSKGCITSNSYKVNNLGDFRVSRTKMLTKLTSSPRTNNSVELGGLYFSHIRRLF